MKTKYVIGDYSIGVNQSPYSNVPGNHIWEKLESGVIGNAITFVYNVDGKIYNEHTRLIASAPDLLAACKFLLEEFNLRTTLIETCDMTDDELKAVKMAERAIFKAEGGKKNEKY
jgi:hypothetical protein